MTLKNESAGWDCGNGMAKFCLNGMVAKIPSGYSKVFPAGRLNEKTLLTGKPIAFGLEIGNKNLFFGQDILSGYVHKLIDKLKYDPEYLMPIFKASLYNWLNQPYTDSEFLQGKRLKITVGIPPKMYEDRAYRAMAEKAYEAIFDHSKTNYIKPAGQKAIPFFTSFGGVKPEALSYFALHKMKPGYTLIYDLGYGTSDVCLLHSDRPDLPDSKSLLNGLFHAYNEMNIKPHLAELAVLRKQANPDEYLHETGLKLQGVLRALQNYSDDIHLVMFGGGIKLLPEKTKKYFKSEVTSLWLGDEYTNARAFEKIGRKE